jgi:hypothetical protein
MALFTEADPTLSPSPNDNTDDGNKDLSIANKNTIHCNNDILLPFICETQKKIGWKPGQDVPESFKTVPWFDGNLGQVQTIPYTAHKGIYGAKGVFRNKHTTTVTSTQHLCNLSPVFCLLHQL